jgi:hypothetical protein
MPRKQGVSTKTGKREDLRCFVCVRAAGRAAQGPHCAEFRRNVSCRRVELGEPRCHPLATPRKPPGGHTDRRSHRAQGVEYGAGARRHQVQGLPRHRPIKQLRGRRRRALNGVAAWHFSRSSSHCLRSTMLCRSATSLAPLRAAPRRSRRATHRAGGHGARLGGDADRRAARGRADSPAAVPAPTAGTL